MVEEEKKDDEGNNDGQVAKGEMLDGADIEMDGEKWGLQVVELI